MATWQQGNAGSLLAGIGTNNTNAPQASDANTALSLIRDNNDRTRAGENNLGMQLAGAAGSIFNSYKQANRCSARRRFSRIMPTPMLRVIAVLCVSWSPNTPISSRR
ncbi:Uncharacterised protein [Klebsiella pneumoniae]|uniref:Uncharacterized protein n=1 Tax=Klebsiella pneumoniae TaxID=573 RepID=A0A377XW19_KLEPN|nr:Uncharacterised protein [Klebsiella pneumoniae]